MVEISFALIRQNNPNANFDKIEEIESIRIGNSNIESIDNLELFSHVKELFLPHNRISIIKNLFFFNNLSFLDLSFNLISSESLLQSLDQLPKVLSTINLTGNPCSTDVDALSKLQDTFPSLGIIIDTVDNAEEASIDDRIANPLGAELLPTETLSRPLNADIVLKSIVERKCKLQSMAAFNLDSTVSVRFEPYPTRSFNLGSPPFQALNQELDSAIDQFAEKRDRRTSHGPDAIRTEESVHESVAARTASLIERNNRRRDETAAFMARLREKSLSQLTSSALKS